MQTRFILSLAVLLISSSPALAQFPQLPIQLPVGPQANKMQPVMDRNINETKAKIQQWNDWLGVVSTKPRHLLDRNGLPQSYSDLVRWTFTPPWPEMRSHPEYAPVSKEIHALRTRIAQVGMYIPEWHYWQFDGLKPNEQQMKYISSLEDKFNSIRSSSGVSDTVEQNLKFVAEVIKRPEMESDSVLKHFRDQLVKPQLAGLIWRNAVIKINYLEGVQKSLRDDFKRSWGPGCLQPCKTRLNTEAARLVRYIDEVKAAGFDLNAHQIMSDPREPLSPMWTLTQLRAEMAKIQTAK